MTKKIHLIVIAALLSFVLAGCGKTNLTASHHTMSPSGLTAIVKGTTNQKKVTYTINSGKQHTQKVTAGAYAITIPAKPYKQTVKITANQRQVTTTVNQQSAISSYKSFQTAYNNTMMATALSKKDQATATSLSAQAAKLKKQEVQIKASVATAQKQLKSGDTSAQATLVTEAKKAAILKADAAKLQQTQASLAPALKQAKAKIAGKTIDGQAKDGIYNLKKTSSATIRGNVHNGRVVGLALMVPTSALKSTKAAKSFMTELAVLTSSTGANTKKVLNGFKDKANKKNSSQTTTSTIHSNGIDFDLGYSTSTLYIYVTRH